MCLQSSDAATRNPTEESDARSLVGLQRDHDRRARTEGQLVTRQQDAFESSPCTVSLDPAFQGTRERRVRPS